MTQADAGGLPVPRTVEGRAGLAGIRREPARALIAMDFDGTLSPIVADPDAARAHPGAAAALRGLAGLVGTLAVITGRPAATAVELGGFGEVPGLIVLGHYGWERWQDGALTSPPAPPGVETARERLPQVLAGAGAPEGTWTEDKGTALAVHTRRAADPAGALPGWRVRWLIWRAAAEAGGGAGAAGDRAPATRHGQGGRSAPVSLPNAGPGRCMFSGDDLGDLAAFGAVRALRTAGHPGLTVCSASGEVSEVTAEATSSSPGPMGSSPCWAGWPPLTDAPGSPRSRAVTCSANHSCGWGRRARRGQEGRPARTFGGWHAQRLVQRPRGLGHVEGVDEQRVRAELSGRACLPGQDQRAAAVGQERAFLGDQVHAVPDRVDQQHVAQPVGGERARRSRRPGRRISGFQSRCRTRR